MASSAKTALETVLLLKLVDHVTAEAKKIKAGYDKELAGMESATGRMATRAKMGMTAAVVAAGAAAALIVKQTVGAINEAMESEAAMSRIESQARRSGFAWMEIKGAVEEYGEAMMNATRYTDEQAIDTLGQMMLYTKDLEKAQKGATLAMDLATVKQMDFGAAAKIVGMAMNGETLMLGRMLPEFKGMNDTLGTSATKSEKAAYAMEILTGKFGGASKASSSTQGLLKEMSKWWAEVEKAYGKALLNTGVIQTILGKITGAFKEAVKFIEEHALQIGDAFSSGWNMAVDGASAAVQAIGAVVKQAIWAIAYVKEMRAGFKGLKEVGFILASPFLKGTTDELRKDLKTLRQETDAAILSADEAGKRAAAAEGDIDGMVKGTTDWLAGLKATTEEWKRNREAASKAKDEAAGVGQAYDDAAEKMKAADAAFGVDSNTPRMLDEARKKVIALRDEFKAALTAGNLSLTDFSALVDELGQSESAVTSIEDGMKKIGLEAKAASKEAAGLRAELAKAVEGGAGADEIERLNGLLGAAEGKAGNLEAAYRRMGMTASEATDKAKAALDAEGGVIVRVKDDLIAANTRVDELRKKLVEAVNTGTKREDLARINSDLEAAKRKAGELEALVSGAGESIIEETGRIAQIKEQLQQAINSGADSSKIIELNKALNEARTHVSDIEAGLIAGGVAAGEAKQRAMEMAAVENGRLGTNGAITDALQAQGAALNGQAGALGAVNAAEAQRLALIQAQEAAAAKREEQNTTRRGTEVPAYLALAQASGSIDAAIQAMMESMSRDIAGSSPSMIQTVKNFWHGQMEVLFEQAAAAGLGLLNKNLVNGLPVTGRDDQWSVLLDALLLLGKEMKANTQAQKDGQEAEGYGGTAGGAAGGPSGLVAGELPGNPSDLAGRFSWAPSGFNRRGFGGDDPKTASRLGAVAAGTEEQNRKHFPTLIGGVKDLLEATKRQTNLLAEMMAGTMLPGTSGRGGGW